MFSDAESSRAEVNRPATFNWSKIEINLPLYRREISPGGEGISRGCCCTAGVCCWGVMTEGERREQKICRVRR